MLVLLLLLLDVTVAVAVEELTDPFLVVDVGVVFATAVAVMTLPDRFRWIEVLA